MLGIDGEDPYTGTLGPLNQNQFVFVTEMAEELGERFTTDGPMHFVRSTKNLRIGASSNELIRVPVTKLRWVLSR